MQMFQRIVFYTRSLLENEFFFSSSLALLLCCWLMERAEQMTCPRDSPPHKKWFLRLLRHPLRWLICSTREGTKSIEHLTFLSSLDTSLVVRRTTMCRTVLKSSMSTFPAATRDVSVSMWQIFHSPKLYISLMVDPSGRMTRRWNFFFRYLTKYILKKELIIVKTRQFGS